MKQIIQMELNKVNPNWREANQLAIYKCGLGLELGTFGAPDQRSNHSATLPYSNYVRVHDSNKCSD